MSPPDSISNFDDSDRTVIRPSPGGRRSPTQITQGRQPAYTGLSEVSFNAVEVEGDNPLVVSAFSLLSLVPKLRNLPFHDAVNELQQRLINEIKSFENRALKKGASRSQMDIAKYLLCSLLDETVLNTPWGSQSGWGHNSLSSLFYKKLVGGEEFFQILDRLKQQANQNQDLLELAYLCLSLGFEGKYRYTNNGLLTLERQRQDLYLLIQKLKGDPQLELSSHWRGIRDLRNPLIQHVPLWVLAGVAGVVLMIIYMIFTFSLRNKSDQLFDDLFAMAQGMKKAPPAQIAQPIKIQKPPPPAENRFEKLLANEISRNEVEVVDERLLRVFNVFLSGNASLGRECQAALAKISRILQQDNTNILIIGHTDNQRLSFSTRYKSNWHLSVARAESAAKALMQYGLPGENIRFEGMADKKPIVPNDTKTNRGLNRRIDIHIR